MLRFVLYSLCILALFLSGLTVASARGFSNNEVHIAVVTDLTGYLSERTGQGSVIAATMAIEDAAAVTGRTRIRLSVIDHQNSPRHVTGEIQTLHASDRIDALVEMASPSVALTLHELADDLGIVALHGMGVSRIKESDCSRLSLHWGPDTYSLGALIAGQIFANNWHLWTLLTPAGAEGGRFQADIGRRITISGAHVSNTIEHQLGGGNVTGELMQAMQSDAEAVAIATSGTELRNVIRQAYELGIQADDKGLAIINMSIFDVQSLGLYATSGLQFAVPFYWDRNSQTREFSRRFMLRSGSVPSEIHANVYSAVLHYLRAVMEIRTDAPLRVVEQMKAAPVDDFYAVGASVRSDGRLMHPMYWVRVKAPSQSQHPWDYLDVVETIPADAAFLPLGSTPCSEPE